MSNVPPLDDLLGRKIQRDGYEWTLRISEITGRLVLVRPLPDAFEAVLKAIRDGALVLETDPADLVAQPLPSDRQAGCQEWLYLDAMIAGARQHGTLTPPAIALLEDRLQALTKLLSSPDQPK